MPECPTPAKRRYATREAAELAAARTAHVYGRLLNPYGCKCGWLHLSKYAPEENYTAPAATDTPRSAA